MRKLRSELYFVDHVLATLACVLSIYSIGMSLAKPKLTAFFLVLTVIGAATGYYLSRKLKGTKAIAYDSYFWAVLGVLATGLVGQLNGILPEEGFPIELIAPGVLCWLLIVGNFFAWRDQTILFLTLPCIAMFGLVGTFDTFRGATVLFFVFLLCIALLYARVHQRTMIERAKRAGVEETDLLRRGPWKWMAGPEWALGSALVVILFSFLGAPVLRSSLKNVAGQVVVSLPQNIQRRSNNKPVIDSDVRIGVGPVRLSDNPVMKVKMDMPRYLRLNAFSSYTGSGWSLTEARMNPESVLVERQFDESSAVKSPLGGIYVWPGFELPPQEPIKDGKDIVLELEQLTSNYVNIVAPGPITQVFGNPSNYVFHWQGWVLHNEPPKPGEIIKTIVRVPTRTPASKKSVLPEELKQFWDVYTNKSNIPARVRDLAYRTAKGKQSDYKVVAAMRDAVTNSILYNTNVGPTPAGKDPVDYSLFESKQGYCEVFASAMTLMARSVGLPSRYATGYIVNDVKTDEKGFYTVREKDYHAWCEIYFEDIGWTPIDPTVGARTADGAGVGTTSLGKVVWYKTRTFIAGVSATMAFAVLIPIIVYHRRRRSSAPITREQAISEIAVYYSNFHRTLERFSGKPRRFSQTSREYVMALQDGLAAHYATAESVVVRFESAMFSPHVPARETLDQMAMDISGLRAELARAKKQKS